MHRDFRELLDSAEGESAFVLAANLDIRGFSHWSRQVESQEAMIYLAKVYRSLIDGYFSDSWFFKPTGDGLFLVRPFTESELEPVVTQTLDSCITIVESFASLLSEDPMINFAVPGDVGIGLAQGAASRLVAGDKTLDYTGRVLNLASRLMDLARPRGIVFDDGFGKGLLGELQGRFAQDAVYVSGVSPSEPIAVHYLEGETVIDEISKRPLDEPQWETATEVQTLAELGEFNHYRIRISSRPHNDKISLMVRHPAITSGGKRHPTKSLFRISDQWVKLSSDPDGYFAVVDFEGLREALKETGVKRTWPVTMEVQYRKS